MTSLISLLIGIALVVTGLIWLIVLRATDRKRGVEDQVLWAAGVALVGILVLVFTTILVIF